MALEPFQKEAWFWASPEGFDVDLEASSGDIIRINPNTGIQSMISRKGAFHVDSAYFYLIVTHIINGFNDKLEIIIFDEENKIQFKNDQVYWHFGFSNYNRICQTIIFDGGGNCIRFDFIKENVQSAFNWVFFCALKNSDGNEIFRLQMMIGKGHLFYDNFYLLGIVQLLCKKHDSIVAK